MRARCSLRQPRATWLNVALYSGVALKFRFAVVVRVVVVAVVEVGTALPARKNLGMMAELGGAIRGRRNILATGRIDNIVCGWC